MRVKPQLSRPLSKVIGIGWIPGPCFAARYILSLLDVEIRVRESVCFGTVKPEPGVAMFGSNTFQNRERHAGKR